LTCSANATRLAGVLPGVSPCERALPNCADVVAIIRCTCTSSVAIRDINT
ncbi:hypothetical protein FIBSPDRAFT_878614, partial [Athelia psychrophila]